MRVVDCDNGPGGDPNAQALATRPGTSGTVERHALRDKMAVPDMSAVAPYVLATGSNACRTSTNASIG
jgi:hypothetical protein